MPNQGSMECHKGLFHVVQVFLFAKDEYYYLGKKLATWGLHTEHVEELVNILLEEIRRSPPGMYKTL